MDVERQGLVAVEAVMNTAEVEDRVEGRQEPMTPLKGLLHSDADSKAEEQTERSASMKNVMVIMRVMMEASVEGCLNAGRKKE